MLGTISRFRDGIRYANELAAAYKNRLLEHNEMFTVYHHLAAFRSREDIIRLIVTSLDYSS